MFKTWMLLSILISIDLRAQEDVMPQKLGIYFLGADQNDGLGYFKTKYVSHPWVDGFAWRRTWGSTREGQPVLDSGTNAPNIKYGQLDKICQIADSLGKDFSFHLNLQEHPTYVTDAHTLPLHTTILGNSDNNAEIQVLVPWDPAALTHLKVLYNLLANHEVDKVNHILFKDHPRFKGLRVNVVGHQHILRRTEQLFNAGYTRELYIQACIDSLSAAHEAFPNQAIWFGCFHEEDSIKTPSLSKAMIDAIYAHFAALGDWLPGCFVELWSTNRPSGNNLADLQYASNKGFKIYLQALGSFCAHDHGKWPGESRWIGDGFNYAISKFGNSVVNFECYRYDINADISNKYFTNCTSPKICWKTIKGSVQNYIDGLQEWHDTLNQ